MHFHLPNPCCYSKDYDLTRLSFLESKGHNLVKGMVESFCVSRVETFCARNLGLIPDGVKPGKGSDHPRMINHIAMSTH